MSSLWGYWMDSTLSSHRCGLESGMHLELREDSVDMSTYGARCHAERDCDLSCRCAADDAAMHFTFSVVETIYGAAVERLLLDIDRLPRDCRHRKAPGRDSPDLACKLLQRSLEAHV